jgi:hypothetical protein
MKLKYRGVPYEYNPPEVIATDSGLTGTYRGVPYSIPLLITEPIPQPEADLIYRGVRYHIGTASEEAVESASISDVATALIEEQVALLKLLFHQPIRNH